MRLLAIPAALAIAAAAFATATTAQEPTPATDPPAAAHDAPSVEEYVAVTPAPTCCPIEVARHRVKRSAKALFACQEVVPVTLCVENPADCCLYSVTLCLPCCCVDEATLCGADRGILGRGVVAYRWSCGLCAEIVFRARGDAVVVYSM